MKVYDCFPFFNELDLLELRLNELDDVVDRFVLVEATKTFQKQDKPLHFMENKKRFERFLDKIVHVVVDEYPGFFKRFRRPTPWDYSNHQKDQVIMGLQDCEPGDKVIISDLDEIPSRHSVAKHISSPGVVVFQQRLSNYFLNCVAVNSPDEPHLIKKGGFVFWRGSVMLNYRDFVSFKKTRLLRNKQSEHIIQAEEAGWHFSFLGDIETIQYKLKNWEHANEAHYSQAYLDDPDSLRKLIEKGGDLFGRDFEYQFIDIDESFPEHIVRNLHAYAKYIR